MRLDSQNQFHRVGAHAHTAVDTATVIAQPATGGLSEGQRVVMVQASAAVRFTLDGTTPTAVIGFRLADLTKPMLLYLNPGMTLTFIGEAAGAFVETQFGVQYKN